jgi:hypothetical protein
MSPALAFWLFVNAMARAWVPPKIERKEDA